MSISYCSSDFGECDIGRSSWNVIYVKPNDSGFQNLALQMVIVYAGVNGYTTQVSLLSVVVVTG